MGNKKIPLDNENVEAVDHLIQTLESNGIGFNKVVESARGLGIQVTQFSHPNLNMIEEYLCCKK